MPHPASWLMALLLFLAAPPSLAANTSCNSPREATASLLDWLHPDNYDPVAASSCFDLGTSKQTSGPKVAVQLKQILDARGLFIPTDELPGDPDYVDKQGRHRFVLVDSLPAIYLEKSGDNWLFSNESVQLTPELYKETFSGLSLAFQELLPAIFFHKLAGVHYWQMLYFILLLLVSWSAGRLLHMLLSGRVLDLARRAGIPLDAAIYNRMRGPITLAAASGVFYWGIPDLQLGVRSTRALLFIAQVTLSFAVVAVAYRLVGVAERVFGRRARITEGKLDDQLVPLVARIAKLVVVLLGVVFVLQNQGVDVASLIAGLGLGGLAFALAAKDTVQNLFGSIAIFLDRPFQIGDWVIIGKDVEGVVEEVGLRTTRVRTFAKSLVSVPNGEVASATVNNMGQRPYRRITTTIGVTYDTPRAKLDAYVARLNEIIQQHPETWKGTVEIHFKDFGASALEIMVYIFLDAPDWHRELQIRHEIFLSFMEAAEQLGISFAFPSTSLYVEKLPRDMFPPR